MPNKSPMATGAAAEKQLKSLVAKFEPKYQRLIREVRKAVQTRFATAEAAPQQDTTGTGKAAKR